MGEPGDGKWKDAPGTMCPHCGATCRGYWIVMGKKSYPCNEPECVKKEKEALRNIQNQPM